MEIKELKHKMPRYRCIKCVSAAKITTLLTHVDGVLDLEMVGPNGEKYKTRMSADWNRQHMPDKGGFLVLYDDGYMSYSPARPFDEGYVLLTENEGSET